MFQYQGSRFDAPAASRAVAVRGRSATGGTPRAVTSEELPRVPPVGVIMGSPVGVGETLDTVVVLDVTMAGRKTGGLLDRIPQKWSSDCEYWAMIASWDCLSTSSGGAPV